MDESGELTNNMSFVQPPSSLKQIQQYRRHHLAVQVLFERTRDDIKMATEKKLGSVTGTTLPIVITGFTCHG